jgi:hypothetical protein
MTPTRPRRAIAAVMLLAAVLLTACGGERVLTASFDPASPCTTDGRMAGAYPDLEALLPKAYEGKAPATVDSGRTCTAAALGTLAAAGVSGVRFAGATWSLGSSSGLTVAVFTGTGLDTAKLFDFYAVPAETASHTDKYRALDTTVAGAAAKRLEVLNKDGTTNTIVVWPDGVDGRVRVLLASDLGDAKVVVALEQFGSP